MYGLFFNICILGVPIHTFFYGCVISNVAKAILGPVMFQGPVNVQEIRCRWEARHGCEGVGAMAGEDRREAEIVLSRRNSLFLFIIYSRKTFEGRNPFAIFYW